MIMVSYHGQSIDPPELDLERSVWLPLDPAELDDPEHATKLLFRELMAERLENGLPGPAPPVEAATALADAAAGLYLGKVDGDTVHWFLMTWQP